MRWKARSVLCLIAAIPMAFANSSDAEVFQYFDETGALLASGTPPLYPAGEKPPGLPENLGGRTDIVFRSYPVFGKTFVDMVKSIEENGPQDRRLGRRTATRLDWKLGFSYIIEYDYEFVEDDQTVTVFLQLSDIMFRNEYAITTPSPVNDAALNPVERTLFRNYIARALAQEHERIMIIEDESVRTEMRKGFEEIRGASFSNALSDADLEQAIERFVRDETKKIGTHAASMIQSRLADHDRSAENTAGSAHGQ